MTLHPDTITAGRHVQDRGCVQKGATVTDVFLSYKAEDRQRVAPLVKALEAEGITVWWDAHIGGGDDWRATIERHLDAARCVLVAWSKRSVGPHGQFVRDEASRAQRHGTYLPIRIDKVDPPLGFGESQVLPLNGWKGNRADPRYRAVFAAVRATLGLEAPADAHPHRPAGLSRRTLVAGGAVTAVAAGGYGAWRLARPAATAPDSIAVLPFANLSGDPSQAYFSDGMAEELRGALSRIAGLKVVARTSSEAMRDADAKEAADKLGVATILTGSVRRSPTLVRISAQLVNGDDGLERWSQVYDRPTGDSLQIQTEIAGHVARALSIQFGDSPVATAKNGGTSNAKAQDLLLRARALYINDDSASAARNALSIVEAVLTIDPAYGDAWAARAHISKLLAGQHSRRAAESRAGYAKAAEYARQAIRIAPRSRLGYWALANILDEQLERRAAFNMYRRMQMLPGWDATTLQSYAWHLSEIGRGAEALKIADQTILLDPLNPRSYVTKAVALANVRRFAEAIEFTQRAINLAPERLGPRHGQAHFRLLLGDIAGARTILAKLPPDHLGRLTDEAVIAARTGDRAESDRLLQQLRKVGSDSVYYQQAQVLTQQGEHDEAILTLEKAWSARDPGLTFLLVDPMLDPLRDDPRFQVILKRLNLP